MSAAPRAPVFGRAFGWGEPEPRVPARVQDAIRRHEEESEILVGWLQLAGVIAFALLYAASRPAFAASSHFEPTPIALAAYGAFTAVRLRLAYRRRLTPLLQYVSVFADVCVLTALIWSYPFQYSAPFALYLKAPTLMYAFILIALRALRYDAAQVIAAGALAAAGWAALVVNAWLAGTEITASYPHYMTSHALLPGAEAEKIAAIVAVTAVLAASVARSRALLIRTAAGEAAARDLTKFVGADAAERIRTSRDGIRAGDGELRAAAIMMVDLRGFTSATAGMPAKEVIGFLQDYQRRIVPVIEAGGGSVDKFLGDGILVTFGAAQPTGAECADAVRTSLKVAAAAAAWNEERASAGLAAIDVCTALAAGEIIYGAVGFGDRLEFTVIGDAVNLAAKLEKHAKLEKARIIATLALVRRAEDQGHAVPILRERLSASVEGAAAPVDLAILA